MGKAFESIKQGLTEAIGHAKGTQAGVKVWRPAAVDVAAVRGRLGFTQAQFAARFGVSVGTLRHWERGDHLPTRPRRGLIALELDLNLVLDAQLVQHLGDLSQCAIRSARIELR